MYNSPGTHMYSDWGKQPLFLRVNVSLINYLIIKFILGNYQISPLNFMEISVICHPI
jgi:hypothetical protein